MFGKIGLPELILILVIALIIFGPRKLPEIGRSIGKGIREFRQATTEISKTVSLDEDEEDEYQEGTSKSKEQPVKEKAEESEAPAAAEIVEAAENQEIAEETDEEENLGSGSEKQTKH